MGRACASISPDTSDPESRDRFFTLSPGYVGHPVRLHVTPVGERFATVRPAWIRPIIPAAAGCASAGGSPSG